MGLRSKFNLVILSAFTVGFILAAIVLDRIAKDSARQQILEIARLMMTTANSVRNYTTQEINPLMPMEHGGNFVPATSPGYSAQRVFKRVQTTFADYSYREAALNPTNLIDRAEDWEADIIELFRNDPTRKNLVVERDTPSGPTLNLAGPITINSDDCMSCHSKPDVAPAALIKTYGTENGFDWQLGETIGAQILTVPMAVPLQIARSNYVTYLTILAAIFAVMFLILNLLLHYLVIVPIKRLSANADAISLGKEGVEPYIKPGKDEISSLSISFNRMWQSLRCAMETIK